MNLVARWMRRPGMTMVLSRSRLLGRRASRSKVGDFSAGIGYIGAIDHLPKARRAWGRAELFRVVSDAPRSRRHMLPESHEPNPFRRRNRSLEVGAQS